jgi:hypothetical protein
MRKAGKQERKLSFPAFLISFIQKACGFSRAWNNAKTQRKNGMAQRLCAFRFAWRLCVEVFRFRRHLINDAATRTREL